MMTLNEEKPETPPVAGGRLPQGCLQVYTGPGKGKTTCALGLAWRALGHGLKVCILHFLKGRDTGEVLAGRRYAPEMIVRSFGRKGRMNLSAPAPADLALVRAGWNAAQRALASGDYDVVVLDEFNPVLAHHLIPWPEVLAALQGRPRWVEVVVTGRNAPPELLEVADLVTEMRPVKHYFQAGVKARRGIEW